MGDFSYIPVGYDPQALYTNGYSDVKDNAAKLPT
jgi:hypothetical protein